MKKLILLITILVISNLEIDVSFRNESRAQDLIQNKIQQIQSSAMANQSYANRNSKIQTQTITKRGIRYRIFFKGGSNDIEVINETKERLEIEKLKLEIRKLKN